MMYNLPAWLIDGAIPSDIYALRIKGNTGAQMLIADGDLVIVKRTAKVQDGGTYVIRWHTTEETAIRRVYDLGLSYELHTEFQQPERVVPCDQVEIQGKVLSVIRHVEVQP